MRDLVSVVTTSPYWEQFPFCFSSVIHLFSGGSALHGARVEGKSDLDAYGIFIEPIDRVVGLNKFEHFVSGSSDQNRLNTAEDIDITMYSLRRWASLATKGNPTALNFLFATNVLNRTGRTETWNFNLARLEKAIVHKRAVQQFRGFVDSQMGRLLGTKGAGKHGQRPELIANFGYDTKAGMHAVRLMLEAGELMRYGKITFPNPAKEALLNIRNGGWSLDRLSSFVSNLHLELDELVKESKLPELPDRVEVDRILVDMYTEQWKNQGLTNC